MSNGLIKVDPLPGQTGFTLRLQAEKVKPFVPPDGLPTFSFTRTNLRDSGRSILSQLGDGIGSIVRSCVAINGLASLEILPDGIQAFVRRQAYMRNVLPGCVSEFRKHSGYPEAVVEMHGFSPSIDELVQAALQPPKKRIFLNRR